MRSRAGMEERGVTVWAGLDTGPLKSLRPLEGLPSS